MRQVGHCVERGKIEYPLLELVVPPGRRATADGHEVVPRCIREQQLEHVAAHQARGAGEKRGAAHGRKK